MNDTQFTMLSHLGYRWAVENWNSYDLLMIHSNVLLLLLLTSNYNKPC